MLFLAVAKDFLLPACLYIGVSLLCKLSIDMIDRYIARMDHSNCGIVNTILNIQGVQENGVPNLNVNFARIIKATSPCLHLFYE